MYCKDGRVLDIRETEDVFYTLSNIASEDWKLAEDEEIHLDVHTFTFGEAIRRLKAGQKVARKGWNGKGMFLFFAKSTDIETKADLTSCENMHGDLVLPSIVMKTADNHFCVGWLASQTDILAEDWVVVE